MRFNFIFINSSKHFVCFSSWCPHPLQFETKLDVCMHCFITKDPKWENDTTTKNQDPVTSIDNEQTDAATHGETTDSRTSGRKRKQPVTRGSDFLWTANSRP